MNDEALRRILLSDLLLFTRFFFKELTGEKFLLNWHIDKISESLTDIFLQKTPNLLINMPPRHGKTIMLIYFTAWALARNPKSKFIYISASDKLTNENSRAVRAIISHPIYEKLFNIKISADTKAKGLWHTEQGGGIMATTINGQITGFGAGAIVEDEFQGAIIVDDPNKIKDFNTELERIPADRFEDTIKNRRNGKKTPIIVNQQRTFINDLSGHILSGKSGIGNDYVHLVFSVLIDGKPLWEEKFGLEEIEKEKLNSDYSWIFDAQYMQNPSPKTGTLFNDIKFYSEIDENKIIHKVIYVDTADEGNDYFAATCGGLIEKDVYVTDVIYNQAFLSENRFILKKFIEKNKPDVLIIEVNKEGTSFITYFTDWFRDAGIRILPVKNTANKLQRILTEEIHIKSNFFFPEKLQTADYRRYLQDLKFFNANMKNKNDDAPDCLAGISKYFRLFKNKTS